MARELSAIRWAQLAAEVRNIGRHLDRTGLAHWQGSLECLAKDCDEQAATAGPAQPAPNARPTLSPQRAALAAWLETSGALLAGRDAA